MMELKRVDVMSLARLYAALGALVGFIIGLIVTIISLAIGSVAPLIPEATMSSTPFFWGMMGALSIIVMPITYAVLGFVSGAVSAFLYNIVAERVGGVELDLQTAKKRR